MEQAHGNWKQEVHEKIAEQIKDCVKCDLSKSRTNAVPGEGNLNSNLMLVGEGPGANEDKKGKPFVGEAGKILENLLSGIGYGRDDVFITNTVKCRPPGNRTPTAFEIETCKPYLVSQIALIHPKVILILGNAALISLMGSGSSISSVRGKLQEKDGIFFFATFHPAAVLYRREIFEIIEGDFKTLKQIMKDKW